MKYTVTIEDESGLVVNQITVNTEYDYDVEDSDSYGDSDHYVANDELQRLGVTYMGKDIGRDIVLDIASNENWDIDDSVFSK